MFYSAGGLRNKIQNAEILRQIKLNRYQNGEINTLLKILESANKQIKKELLKYDGIVNQKKYAEIKSFIEKISKTLRTEFNEELDNLEFIEKELDYQIKLLKKININLKDRPNPSVIKKAVQFKPFTESTNFQQFLDGIESGIFNTWDNAVRIGYLSGTTTKDIVRSVVGKIANNSQPAQYGTIQSLRNSIERNTRTYLQSITSETRKELYSKNEGIFSGYKYLATLDRRTCLVCGNLDGKIFADVSEFPSLPIHYNCRCLIIPIVKDYENESGVRASSNGYVSEEMDYDDWLRTQSEETQKYILGKKRFDMYQENGSVGQFVNDGKIINLSDL